MAKILIVEDDKDLSELICRWLENEHYTVDPVYDGSEGLSRSKAYQYDLLLLDWELPGITGIDILKAYRAQNGTSPVLMVTGKNTVANIEDGLNAGADDYLTKPFHARILTARLRALLRRSPVYLGEILTVGALELDKENYKVMLHDQEIHLLPREFKLLHFLMRNPNRVFPADLLLSRVWEDESDSTVAALTSCMKRLRKKIEVEGQPQLIRTIHSVGYKFCSEP